MKSFLLAGLLLLLIQISVAAQTVVEDQIGFTVVDAPWMVVLDNKNFNVENQEVKRDGKSGYFLLRNEKDGITASLFIEPAVKCKTSLECRDFVWKTGNPKWGKMENVVQSKIGEVSYFEFFRPSINNQPLQMFDMYAEFVENGYWVDLHISKVFYKKEDHAFFENYVKAVRFISKTGNANAESVKTISAAQKALEAWMTLRDSGKYAESYKELSSYSKKAFSDKQWFEYSETARKPFGNLKSRKILQFQMIKSLEGIPDRPGAIFRYLSSFENQKDIFETFTVVLEKDGTWRAASYNTND